MRPWNIYNEFSHKPIRIMGLWEYMGIYGIILGHYKFFFYLTHGAGEG